MLYRYLFTFVCLMLWLLSFSIGAFVDSNPLRAKLALQFEIDTFLLVVLAWIPTSLAFIAVLAGLSGALGRSLLRSLEVDEQNISQKKEQSRIIGGGVAGLMLYLALMASAFLLMDAPFETTTKEQYFRIAGVVSFASFIAGFRPDLLRRIVSKLPGF
jgi:hypothetical protein